jgi:hypothetical protein
MQKNYGELMMHKTDKLRIEDALLPAIMCSIMKIRDGESSEKESAFANVYPILRAQIYENINTPKLMRRLDRITGDCMKYFADNKFRTSKSFITTTIWGLILYRKRAVWVDKKSDIYRIWRDFYYTVRDDGIAHIDGFQKLYDSAVGHISSLHGVVIKEGYFR